MFLEIPPDIGHVFEDSSFSEMFIVNHSVSEARFFNVLVAEYFVHSVHQHQLDPCMNGSLIHGKG